MTSCMIVELLYNSEKYDDGDYDDDNNRKTASA